MPLWVARQWHVFGTPRWAIGHIHGVAGRSRYAAVVSSRSSSQTSTQDEKSLKLAATNSAIIVPSSSTNTKPEDLIEHIQPVARSRLSRDRFAVFFLTPAFAPWLLNDESFLHKALRRAYQHIFGWEKLPYARIHALCAVVDKLPIPKPIFSVEALEHEASQRTRQPPVSETGYEGLAYATLRFADSIPASSPAGESQAAISFLTSAHSDANGFLGDALRLPLANTVFQTGLPTMMTLSTWEKARGAEDLTLKSKESIEQHGIRLHSQNTSQSVSSLAIPLVPLTAPRRVDAIMGNILRRVVGQDGKSVTASQELEQVVPLYFRSRREPPQATTVWALVIPPYALSAVSQKTQELLGRLPDEVPYASSATEQEAWQSLWQQDPPVWTELVPAALAAGARLHRVLSGGGGWGKKAGLLSLDPVPTMEAAVAEGAASMFDGPADLSSALQQVVHDGDSIQFFTSPYASRTDISTLPALSEVPHRWGWELGTIPSTIDSPLLESSQHGSTLSNKVYIFRNSFGALAEGGMTMERRFKLKPGDSYSLVGTTKVDVPFSRFSMVGLAEDHEDVEEDSMHGCLESLYVPYHSAAAKRLFCGDAPPLLQIPRLACQVEHYNPAENEAEATTDLQQASTMTGSDLAYPTSTASVHNGPGRRRKMRIFKNLVRKQRHLRIRFYNMQRDIFSETNYCLDKLRQTQKAVQRLTDEYRLLMRSIRVESIRQGIMSSLKDIRRTTKSSDRSYDLVRNLKLVMRSMADLTDQSATHLSALQHEYQLHLDSIKERLAQTWISPVRKVRLRLDPSPSVVRGVPSKRRRRMRLPPRMHGTRIGPNIRVVPQRRRRFWIFRGYAKALEEEKPGVRLRKYVVVGPAERAAARERMRERRRIVRRELLERVSGWLGSGV